MKNLKEKIFQTLKNDPRIWNEEQNELNQTLLFDLLDKIDEKIISLLGEDEELKNKFFLKIKDFYVFKTNDFKFFIEENKIFNSYTKYKNQIGLTDGRRFLKESGDVVLDFPFKDCILEGGQSTEEGIDKYFEYEGEKTKIVVGEKITEPAGYKEKQAKRKEIFFNQILAQDEIDRLFDEKALVNWQRFSKNGQEKVKEIKRDKDGTIKENLIIKGNNLLALHSLKKQFAGKVKLIYIDPPYNTGNDGFKYNDNFNHSTWLTFMKNRLEVAKELLRDDGVIFVQCDDNEQAYLKVLMDDIFGDNRFLNTLCVKAKATSGASGGGEDKKIKKNIEYIHIYNKSDSFEKFNDQYSKLPLQKYMRDLNEEGKSFAYNQVMVDEGNKTYYKSTKDGRGDEIKIFKHDNYVIKSVSEISKIEGISKEDVCIKYIDKIFTSENAQTSIRERVLKATDSENNMYSIEYIPVSGKNKGFISNLYFLGSTKRLVSHLKNTCEIENKKVFKLLKMGALWSDISWSAVAFEGGIKLESGKKPELLMQRVIDLSTQPNDIVLDFFLGSGTTCAVAHKMNRQYIGIEQMDYIETIAVERMKKVIEGEQGGISKAVQWQDGGDFIYFELAKHNETAKEKILNCQNLAELARLFDELYEKYFLNYNLKIREFKEKVLQEKEFQNLDLDQQKKMFLTMLDLNQIYVNKSEMADDKFAISKEDQSLTSQFYNTKKPNRDLI